MLDRVDGMVRSRNNETRKDRETPVEPVSVRKRVGLKKRVEVARNDFLSECWKGGRNGSRHPAGQGAQGLVL